jgi:hypothetical protein
MVNRSLNIFALFVWTETIYRISSGGQKGLPSKEVLSIILNYVWNNVAKDQCINGSSSLKSKLTSAILYDVCLRTAVNHYTN